MQVVTVDGMELASQLFDFEIINGLETKVAQEVMIYDWITLTRDAQNYIDQFVSNEATRQQQFADAQTQRGITFGESEAGRTITFNASEAGRTTIFNASEAGRTTAFNAAEEARATGYDADHSRAGTDHTTAVNDHTLAGTDHTTAANDHTLAGTDHTRAEADHTRADSDSATVAGFNARMVAEETATANNKISAVKGKTFADVDARFEDVEADTTMMGMNLVTNGDFSNGTVGFGQNGTGGLSVVGGIAEYTATTQYGKLLAYYPSTIGNIYYSSALVKSASALVGLGTVSGVNKSFHDGSNTFKRLSQIAKATLTTSTFSIQDDRTSGWDKVYVDNVILIDLTATFGAGNEPTVEQMDGIMAKFTNSWFNGTANLFRANAALNKLMAVDARTEFEAKNAVTNGDFSNGTTGWVSGAATVSAASNTLTIIGDGTNMQPNVKRSSVFGAVTDKYYVRAKARVTNAICTHIKIGQYSSYITKTAPSMNVWYEISGIQSNLSDLNMYLVHQYVDAASSNGMVMEVQYVSVINLTQFFGAGKEPTQAEMDRLMARFPNSWFDGVKPIQTIEQLYQEKANKVQEAWITPTLLNGWVNYDAGRPPRYMKDNFGVVRFSGLAKSGTINTPIFTLPVGYYKPNSQFFIVKAGEATQTFGTLVVNYLGEVRLQDGLTTLVTLDHVSFRID